MAAQINVFENLHEQAREPVSISADAFAELVRAISRAPNNDWSLLLSQREGIPASLLLAIQYLLKQVGVTISRHEHALESMSKANIRMVFLNEAIARWSKVDLALFNEDTQDVVQLYHKSLDDIRHAYSAECAAFVLIDEHNHVQHYVTEGFDLDTQDIIGADKSSLTGLAELLTINDVVVLDDAQLSVMDLPQDHVVLNNLIAFPIRANNNTIGFIYVANKKNTSSFDDDDKHVSEWLGNELSALFERQQLTRQLQREKDEQARLIEHIRFAQSQLAQAEKMASVARLAAGVAHEVNTPIGYVSSNVVTLKSYINGLLDVVAEYAARDDQLAETDRQHMQQLRMRHDVEFIHEDSAHLIEESTQGLLQVSSIVKSLESLCQWQQEERDKVNINECVDKVLQRFDDKSGIQLQRLFGDVDCIPAVSSQIEQMLRSVIDNAVRAVDAHGEIRIETGMQGEQGVFINISDNGRGIEQENLSKIFDPFYTSREIGEGMGLGLSLTYNIIDKHNGSIRVESAVDEGTTFYITLTGDNGQ